MCGKYILAQAAKAERAMGIRRGRWEYPVSYRVLPTEQVPLVVPLEGEREAVQMRWGLLPWWAHGVPLKASTINATVERIDTYDGPLEEAAVGLSISVHLSDDLDVSRGDPTRKPRRFERCAQPLRDCCVLRGVTDECIGCQRRHAQCCACKLNFCMRLPVRR